MSSNRHGGFVCWFAVALVLDQTEKWRSPLVAGVLVLLLAALALTSSGDRARAWLALALVGVSGADALARAPDLPNHGNLTLYVDGVLLAALLAESLRQRRLVGLDAAVFERAAPALRGGVIVCYGFAAFHKLNRDFFEPSVSCAGWFVDKLTELYARTRFVKPPSVVLGLAAVVVAVELAMAVGLTWSRTRRQALVLGWALHGVLALTVFFDFSALMLALYWAFAPEDDRLAHRPDHVRLSIVVQLVGVLVSAVVFGLLGPRARPIAYITQGVLFNVAVAIVAVPLVRAWRRDGAPQPSRGWSLLDGLGPVLLAGFAASNYLGLRTGGTFSMFSNLRTEAGVSNHLVVTSPLRLLPYGSDLISIDRLDVPQAADHGNRLVGADVPRVELEKMIWRWRQTVAQPIRARYRDNGEWYDTVDLAHDPRWPVTTRTWAMRLLDFRVVQRAGPNLCRW